MDALEALIQPIATILVALIVALAASQRDVSGRGIERFHRFIDERKNAYVGFLQAMSEAEGALWRAREEGTHESFQVSDRAALELDAKTYVLTIVSPKAVSAWVKQVNGAIQTANAAKVDEANFRAGLAALEKAKPHLLMQMKANIDMIETSGSRRRYEKRLR